MAAPQNRLRRIAHQLCAGRAAGGGALEGKVAIVRPPPRCPLPCPHLAPGPSGGSHRHGPALTLWEQVTGGGTGIGAAIAKAYAGAGATVVVASRTQANLDSVVADISAAGGQAAAIVCDVTEEASVLALVADTVAQFGQLDIMVNNSGGARNIGRPESFSYQGWLDEIALNLNSVFLGSQTAAKQMIAQGSGGKIINISCEILPQCAPCSRFCMLL